MFLSYVGFILFALFVLILAFESVRKSIYYFFLFLGFGYLITALQNETQNPNHYSHFISENAYYSGVLLSDPIPTKRAFRLEIELTERVTETTTSTEGKVFIYVPKNDEYAAFHIGDIVLFKSNLKEPSPPLNPHEFDYQNYLQLHQIYAQSYASSLKKIGVAPFSFNRIIGSIRRFLLNKIDNMPLSVEEKSVASALLLGYRYLISDGTQQAFAGAGAMHVLAVSGLHVGILFIITATILGLDKKHPQRNNWKKVVLSILIIWSYAALTGLSPSVTRAAVMFSFIGFGNLFKRKPGIYQAIAASAFFLLAINPNYLFEVGFQLSYAAVLGIVYIQPKIYHLFDFKRIVWIDKIWAITTVSIAAQAATFPLSIYYFHQFPLFFIVSNLVVIPTAYLLMSYGLGLLTLSIIISPPAFLILPFKWLLMLMIKSVELVESLPHSVVYQLNFTRTELVLAMVLVIAIVEVVWHKKKNALVIGMLSLFAFFSLTGFARYQQKRAKQVTIYSIPKTTAIEFTVANASMFYGDKILLEDEDKMLFHVRHNQWAKNVSSKQYDLEKYTQNGFLHLENVRILLLERPEDTLKFTLNPNIILLKGNLFPPNNKPNSAKIILLNGLQQETRKIWKEHCFNAHDLATDGAFELAF